MIALASSPKCSDPSSAAQASKGGTADAPGAAQPFRAILAAAAPLPAVEAQDEATPELELGGKLTPGTALPISAAGGKTLPVLTRATTASGAPAFAVTADEAGTNPVRDDVAPREPAEAESDATPAPDNAVLPPAILPQLPVPPAEGEASVLEASGAAGSRLPVATPAKDRPAGQSSPSASSEPKSVSVGQAPAASVAIHIAAPMTALNSDRPLSIAEAAIASDERGRPVQEDGPSKEASFSAAPVNLGPQHLALASLPPNTLADPARGQTHGGPKESPSIAAMHELTSVVDRLVAAREAFAPATAAITLEHGELGDLSLRFDQHRDGHLAVQLSASDPDAHRAMVAAISDAGLRGTPDGHTETSQQSPHSQAHAREGSAERESGSARNGFAARQDQSQQRRPGGQQQPGRGRQRAGVFA